MAKTNFDQYLKHKLEDPEFRKRFEEADKAWDIALQLAALRKARGLTQQQVADLLGTKQQAIARLEDPSYTGHSLSMVKKYAEALGATVQVTITSLDGGLAPRSKGEKAEGDVQRALAVLEASGLVKPQTQPQGTGIISPARRAELAQLYAAAGPLSEMVIAERDAR